MENDNTLNNTEQTSSTNTRGIHEVIQNIRNEILPNLQELKGQDPEVIESFLDTVISKHTAPEQKDVIMNAVILTVSMPEQNPDKPWEKPNAGVSKKDGRDALKTLANDISKGKNSNNSQLSGKRLKFTVPFSPAELDSLKDQGESAKNYIREKIKTAVKQANLDITELDRGQTGVNFKNFGSRSANIKTTGHTLIEALTEIIYVSAMNSKDMNPEQVKGACEQSMGTASNTGMQAGNMIDDMVNGTGDEVERTQEGFTFSAG